MTTKSIMITGGAGFVGSHLTDLLIKLGHEVFVVDYLDPQVHVSNKKPAYLNKNATFIKSDFSSKKVLKLISEKINVVFHLASTVGIGQSMYQIYDYIKNNTSKTSKLIDAIINNENKIEKFVVASSMSVYGEGEYFCTNCGKKYPKSRNLDQLKKRNWELVCDTCNEPLKPVGTTESKTLNPESIYALSKRHQEEITMMIGKTYGLNTTALRFFNIYGTRQSLSNPYTGVCAIFLTSLLSNENPIIFEDGFQSRDFINVKDVCNVLNLSITNKNASNQIINVGTGIQTSVIKIYEILSLILNKKINPIIKKQFRKGDVRHCYSNITKLKKLLEYNPAVDLKTGITDLIKWTINNDCSLKNKSNKMIAELQKNKLLI